MTYPPNGPDQQPSSGPFGASGDPNRRPQQPDGQGQYPQQPYQQDQYPQQPYPQGQYPQQPYQQGQYPGFAPGPAGGGTPQGFPQATCVWHGDRPTAVSCSRCGRPACPECLTPASVGQHCRACIAEARATQRVPMTVSGARLGVPPLIASILIGINVLVYVVTAINAGSVNSPEEGTVFRDGALIPLAVGAHEYWRVLTSGFLHIGLFHLLANMISLYFIGPTLEQVLGRTRFLTVYLLSLLGGSLAVLFLSLPVAPAAGASGAIFGLMGALLVTFRRLRLNLTQIGGVILLNLFITFTFRSAISWQGHLGGFVVGALIGAAMVYPPQRLRTRVQVGVSALLAVVLIVGCVVGAAVRTPYNGCIWERNGSEGTGIYATPANPGCDS